MMENYDDSQQKPSSSARISRSSMQFDDLDTDIGNEEVESSDQYSLRLHRRYERFPFELNVMPPRSHVNYPGESSKDMHLLVNLIAHSFALPDLIWTYTTSQELKYALEEALLEHEEMVTQPTYFQSMTFAWNHCSFQVTYPSLAKEIQVGTYYLRILMDNVHDGVVLIDHENAQTTRKSLFVDVDMDLSTRSNYMAVITHSVVYIETHPAQFFDMCYQRWLQELPFSNQTNAQQAYGKQGATAPDSLVHGGPLAQQRDNAEIWCLQLMVATYRAYSIGTIQMEKVAFVVRMLRLETRALVIEELLSWLSTIALDKKTCLSLLTKGNMELFLDISTLIHEHTPLTPASTNILSKRMRSIKSLKQLEQIESTSRHRSNPFAYFNFFKGKGDENELDAGETNIDMVEDNFAGEVYWYDIYI
jgi:hypothetical protein